MAGFTPLLVRASNVENYISVWNRKTHTWQFMRFFQFHDLRAEIAIHDLCNQSQNHKDNSNG